jgi:Saxitoxin biosynthesis operon protein SxtJ
MMTTSGGMHEQFDKRDDVKAPSERSFGFTFTVVFALLAAFSWWHSGMGTRAYILLGLSAVFLAITLLAPRLLRPLNLIWLKFGLLLHKVVNPVIMGLLFFGVFTPMGVAMRLFGVDFLRLKRKPPGETYWIVKGDDSIPDSSMKNQF